MNNMFLYINAIDSFVIEKTRDWSIKSKVNSKWRQITGKLVLLEWRYPEYLFIGAVYIF